MTRIVITCSRGSIRSVYTDAPDVEVEVVDWDLVQETTDEPPDRLICGYRDTVERVEAAFPAAVMNEDLTIEEGEVCRGQTYVVAVSQRYGRPIWRRVP